MKEGIDVIVVNYRTDDDLRHFLMSLEKHPPTIPWSLVVVNVAPFQKDVDVVQHYMTNWNVPTTCHLVFEENVGYARAANRAASYTNYDTLAIFNADTRLTEDLIDTCYDALHSHPEWAILGPRQIDDTHRITHGGIFLDGDRGFHQINRPEFADIRDDAVTVSGSAYFIKREVWDILTTCEIYQSYCQAEGAFLPTPHYWEDTWTSYHAREHGYKVVYYGPVWMIHNWHRSSPVGGWAERQISVSRNMFRDVCDLHGITHE